VAAVHPGLVGVASGVFGPTDPDALADSDLVFLALPHGESGALVAELPPDLPIVDLGADFRLRNPGDWHHYYGGTHAGTWPYGLPELPDQRAELLSAQQIANPGCYATAVALALAPTAVLARYTRSSVLEVLGQDYVRTARAKGLLERVVVSRHVLKNALIPVVTVGGVEFAFLMTGSFFVERIANVPGLGRAGVRALMGRDYPVIMGIVLFFSIIIVFANLLVDVLYAFLDPRIRATERT
jgi:hypothetical protein